MSKEGKGSSSQAQNSQGEVVIRGQTSLKSLLRTPNSPSPEPVQKRFNSTSHFLQFTNAEMGKLIRFMQTPDGSGKSEKSATTLSVCVSKYLYFCGKTLNWDHLLDCDLMQRFLAKLREAGAGAHNDAHLLAFHHGPTFLQLGKTSDTDHERLSKLRKVMDKVALSSK